MCLCHWMSLCTLANTLSVREQTPEDSGSRHLHPGDSGSRTAVSFEASGNVYATDLITNTLVRLAAEGAALTLFIEKSDTGTLFSIDIQPEEAAVAPVMFAPAPARETPGTLEWIEARRLVVVESTPGQASTVTLSGNAGAQEGLANGFEELVAAALTEDFAWVLEVQSGLDFGAQGTRSLLVRAYRVAVPPLLP